MGGGTFSYDVPAKTADESEQVFRTAMNESEEVTEEPRLRNVFISFAVEDEVRVNLLRSQAKDDNFDVEFRDYSVKEPFDEKWKPEVSDLISMTSAVIVMIGVETAKSRAVDWEIREAHRQGKKVIGVRIYRDQNHQVPPAIKQFGSPVINWDTKKLATFLR